MRITKIQLAGAILALGGLSLAACRGSDNKDQPDASMTPIDGSVTIDGMTAGGMHIQDVQNGSVKEGDAVELHGVVIVAFDTFGAKTGDLWLEEPGGGAYSGVHVFGAPVAQTASLVVGDIVDLKGAIKTEFVLKNADGTPQDKSGRTTTELQAPKGGTLTITKTGHTTPPAAYVLDANALDAMPQATRDAELEKWEGVLIKVTDVRSRTFPIGFGAKPFPDDAYKTNITANLVLESTQTKFVGVDGLTCYASVTGVADYFFDWLLLPRNADDLVPGTTCTPVTVTDSTIDALQATTPSGAIKLTDVYVTARSNSGTSFWASTTPVAAPSQGVYVFQSSSTLALDPKIVPGAKVTVTGTVSEFNDDTMGGSLTEVAPLRLAVSADAPVALTPVTGKTVTDLTVPATGPLYESVLVTLDNVAITAVGSSANGFLATAKQGGVTFSIGTDIIQLAAADLACYKTMTGLWTNLQVTGTAPKPNAFGFIVRTLGTKDGTCN
jgi:hypothetical protein